MRFRGLTRRRQARTLDYRCDLRHSLEEVAVKDLRCLVGVHSWKKRHVEDSAYIECRRCGKQADAPTRGPLGTGGGLGF